MVGPNGVNRGNLGGGAIVMVNGQRLVGAQNMAQLYGGALLGKIGDSGESFLVGERYDGRPETEGKLYLQIGPRLNLTGLASLGTLRGREGQLQGRTSYDAYSHTAHGAPGRGPGGRHRGRPG